MSDPSGTTAPVEYGVSLPQERREVDADERRRMYEEYGRVRTFFKLRPDRFPELQRWLTQARIPLTYDEYLAASVRYALLAGVLGAILGLALTWLLAATGVLVGLRTGVGGDLALFVGRHRVAFAAGVLAPTVGAGFAVSTWYARYYYPATVIASRRRNINVVLPHAIVYMYALSYGGMDLAEVMESLAESTDTYDEVANEFAFIVSDLDLFGTDLYAALRNARNLTPSDHFEQFLDDLISVLDAGGDVTTFLGEASESYLRDAEDEQEEFLETLAVMAEIFVVAFVAAPLFLIVTLVVISLIGGNTIGPITVIVYVAIPAATVAFLALLDVLNKPFEQSASTMTRSRLERPDPDGTDDRFEAYGARQRRLDLRGLLADPFAAVRTRPSLSLVASVPAAVLLAVVLVAAGVVTPTMPAMRARPIATTTGLVVAPLLVALAPWSVAHEVRRRRENEIARRFPNTLNILSSANRMGIPLQEAFALVSRWSTGPLAEELRTVRNDIEWNHDTRAALLDFGARLRVPQLSRTMKLLADGIRSSGDLTQVLAIAAEDTRNRHRLERARSRELSAYIAVVIIGFLVYLLVILVLEASFLRPIGAVQPASGSGDLGAPVSFVDVPLETYRMVFLHSALIMAAGTGLLAAKLAVNDTVAGLKYAIGLVVLTVATFTMI